MSNQPSYPDDHFHYGCFPRPSRRGTPAGSNNNNNNTRRGLFHLGQGGRTVLPPLHLPFRTSRSPAPDSSLSSQLPQQDPTQTHTDPSIAHFSQQGWQPNQVQGHQQAVPFSSDPRYQSQQQAAYGSYPSRSSPNMIGGPQDSRILPPLNMGPSQMPSHHIPMTSASQVRSPTGAYQTYATAYPQHQPSTFGYPGPAPPDPRHLPPPLPMSNPYDQTSSLGGRRGSLVERSNPLRTGGHGASPYPRVPSVVPNVPEPPVEPVKKKRKRADAEQLKVLNETYNRTAFPSTEERIELAKKLGMSARSVQIWFQNKRQAMRQSSRQAAATAPPTTSQPYATPSHSSSATPAAPTPQPAGYPSSLTGASSASQAGYGTTRPSSGMSRLNTSPSPSSHRRSHEDEPHRHDPRRFPSPRPF